jgi:hypothetical protein
VNSNTFRLLEDESLHATIFKQVVA